jgi:hypothetical protein
MKDRRIVALERVLSRRRDRDRKLNAALAALRGQLGALQTALDERRAAACAQVEELDRQDGKIEAMLRGVAIRADALLLSRECRALAAQRHAALEAEAARAAAALAEQEAAVSAARGNVLRNRARIDIYGKRLDLLVRAREAQIEDAQDEETSENRRPAPAF